MKSKYFLTTMTEKEADKEFNEAKFDYQASMDEFKKLTANLGSLTKDPKLDGEIIKDIPLNERPSVRLLTRNSARMICINEADAFLPSESSSGQTTYELVKAFINAGFKASRPIACFRHASMKGQSWGTTFSVCRH